MSKIIIDFKDDPMQTEFFTFVGAVLSAIGLNELRLRWLKTDISLLNKQLDDLGIELGKEYMRRDDIIKLYGMMSQAHDDRLGALEKRFDRFEDKLDKIVASR